MFTLLCIKARDYAVISIGVVVPPEHIYIRIIRDINSISLRQRAVSSPRGVSPFNKNSSTKTRRREAFSIFLSACVYRRLYFYQVPGLRDSSLRFFPPVFRCNQRYTRCTDVQLAITRCGKKLARDNVRKNKRWISRVNTEPLFLPLRAHTRLCERSQQRRNGPTMDNKIWQVSHRKDRDARIFKYNNIVYTWLFCIINIVYVFGNVKFEGNSRIFIRETTMKRIPVRKCKSN